MASQTSGVGAHPTQLSEGLPGVFSFFARNKSVVKCVLIRSMKLYRAVVLMLLAQGSLQTAIFAAQPNAASTPVEHPAGSFSVEVLRCDWFDAKRERKVPVKIYYPSTSEGKFPVIIFSHGLGGSREGYEYLGRHWAGCGYVSVHVQHLGSDDAVWQGLPPAKARDNMRAAAANLANITNRPADLTFVINQLERMNLTNSVLKQRLDLDRIGVAGHSFGAFTALAIAGETFIGPGGQRASAVDPRVKAVIPMSAPAPRNRGRLNEEFGTIKIPCLHMTGTDDGSVIGSTSPKERRLAFDHSRNSDQFLITFTGGDHMIFSGRRGGNSKNDDEFQKLICIGSTAFLDAYLTGDASARAYFTGGGFQRALGHEGTFEMKLCPENGS